MRPRPLQPAWAHTRRDQVARLGVEYPQVAPVDDAIFAKAGDLENVRDAPCTVGPEAAHDHQIEVLGDHLADGVRVNALGGELGESPELAKGPPRRVRVQGSEALVARCRRKKPIERFGAAALANHQDIRSEPQGGAHQLPIRACASAFDVRAMGIQWDRRGVILVQR